MIGFCFHCKGTERRALQNRTSHSHFSCSLMMSRPVLPEPPAKRHRAQGEDREHYEVEGGSEEDEEFHRLEAVSAVQDELNALEEEEAQQVHTCWYIDDIVLLYY